MEAIKSITQEPVIRQPESVTPASSVSDTQNNTADFLNNLKKESHAAEQVNKAMAERINRIAEAMDSYVRSIQSDLKIRVNEKTGDIIVKVISRNTGKVIREIPPEELLDLAAHMEELAGTFFDKKI